MLYNYNIKLKIIMNELQWNHTYYIIYDFDASKIYNILIIKIFKYKIEL